MNFLSLDLELNNAPDNTTPNPKIIEVGVSIGDLELSDDTFKVFHWYLDPREPIYPNITELTGITDEDISNRAVSHETCAQELSDLIAEHKCFVNPVTWGGGDSVALLKEFRDRGITFNHFGRRWIDVKTYHVMRSIAIGGSYKGGLSSVMGRYRLPFKGTPHRAHIDAFNTLRLFKLLVNRHNTLDTTTSGWSVK
jgi:DNA polymerase III epsilon subunit-like protein